MRNQRSNLLCLLLLLAFPACSGNGARPSAAPAQSPRNPPPSTIEQFEIPYKAPARLAEQPFDVFDANIADDIQGVGTGPPGGEPAPEPATLFLVGTGIAAAAVFQRRRLRRRSQITQADPE